MLHRPYYCPSRASTGTENAGLEMFRSMCRLYATAFLDVVLEMIPKGCKNGNKMPSPIKSGPPLHPLLQPFIALVSVESVVADSTQMVCSFRFGSVVSGRTDVLCTLRLLGRGISCHVSGASNRVTW
jgi:hypothetical protein